VGFFYQDLVNGQRIYVDASAGGSILGVTPERTIRIFDEIATNVYQWPSERVSGCYGFESFDQGQQLSVKSASVEPSLPSVEMIVAEVMRQMSLNQGVNNQGVDMVEGQIDQSVLPPNSVSGEQWAMTMARVEDV